MRAPKDIFAYAQGILGFPIHDWMSVTMLVESIGAVAGVDHTVPAGASGKILSVDWFNPRDRLTITVEVGVPGVKDCDGDPATITQTFDERDPDKSFFALRPIVPPPGEKVFRVNARAVSHLTRSFDVSARDAAQARAKADEIIENPPWVWETSGPEDEQIESIEEAI